MAKPESRYEQKYSWAKQNTVRLSYGVTREVHPEIIEKLDSTHNKADYLRALIRKDMKKHGVPVKK